MMFITYGWPRRVKEISRKKLLVSGDLAAQFGVAGLGRRRPFLQGGQGRRRGRPGPDRGPQPADQATGGQPDDQ